jgi:hypothetical protein
MLDRITAQNGIGGEALIWLIIAFLWVVAQVVNRFKEQARRRQMAERGGTEPPAASEEEAGNTFEREMRKFLETIGAEPMPVEEAKPVPPPRPKAPRRRVPPPPSPVVMSRDDAAYIDRPRMAEVRTEAVRIGEMDTRIDEGDLDTDRAYALPDDQRPENFNAFVNPRTLLVNLNYLRMNMPLIPVTGLSSTSETRPRPQLHGRSSLRDALITQIILSNPLAMGEDKASYTKRVV